ncbi:hypothetical protein K491DRAFT_680763 [Lophiostoma macrostomum CBS 122681]|uniref:Uncharacterized protein n=1 Tax=Lophiostoma macrostomum CBS 122681 TaxID=1314788 RepID=A0A6A6T2N3_9PLEO|nr:hypothetical protein K491DRAFT_680763 [Lophiostoma macrostomum CBS 122681]
MTQSEPAPSMNIPRYGESYMTHVESLKRMTRRRYLPPMSSQHRILHFTHHTLNLLDQQRLQQSCKFSNLLPLHFSVFTLPTRWAEGASGNARTGTDFGTRLTTAPAPANQKTVTELFTKKPDDPNNPYDPKELYKQNGPYSCRATVLCSDHLYLSWRSYEQWVEQDAQRRQRAAEAARWAEQDRQAAEKTAKRREEDEKWYKENPPY